MEGLIRGSILLDPELPPLTAEIPVISSRHLELCEGKQVYAPYK